MTVPFLYVNISALCLFCMMMFAFLFVKKTPEIRSFILLLIGFIFWTGASILMRLQIFPGSSFWFYVSIMSLFSCGVLIYNFIASFVKSNGYILRTVWLIGTAILLIFTAMGVFLNPPVMETNAAGGNVFKYETGWPIAIPLIFFVLMITSMLTLFRRYIKEKGIRSPGIILIIIGCVTLALGNMFQIFPGNTFPWDTFAGAVFAMMLMFAIYRKKMFQITLLISRSLLAASCAVLYIFAAAYCIIPLHGFFVRTFELHDETATFAVVVLFTISFIGIYSLIKRAVDSMFHHGEQQSRRIENFSAGVAQTLDIDRIFEQLFCVIRDELGIETQYFLLLEGNDFVAKYRSNPLDPRSFMMREDNPCVRYLKNKEPYVILSEFRRSPHYLSMREQEKQLLSSLNAGCAVALRDSDELAGIILLPAQDKSGKYSFSEISFLRTVSTIASIALKNASLFERVCNEARIDSLTEVYNYRYFIEETERAFAEHGRECLSLMYFDLDDFKLFNQLNGATVGDEALFSVARLIVRFTGTNGTVFRHSGKVFAVLLPGMDEKESEVLADSIKTSVSAMHFSRGKMIKPLTLSAGICVAPYAASSAKELIANADLAVYSAKQMGKNHVVVFHPHRIMPGANIAERAARTVERVGVSASNNYANFSSAVYALTSAIYAKDTYTFNHSENVARYASVLATAIGLEDEQVRIIYEAGLLHDIGKINIPKSILTKPGALTDEEFALMKTHVDNSIEMIRHLPSMDYVIPATIAHHERWDGGGYPLGIAGEDIPIAGRCLAIADAFDAMTTTRPYRKALSPEYAAEQIEKCAGSQFDPALAAVFTKLYRDGDIVLNQ